MIARAVERAQPLGWPVWLVRAGLLLATVLLAVDLAHLLHAASVTLGYPYDRDYGEGIVWQQMTNIVAGHGYAPLGVFPAIVYHYPPVYHLTTAVLAAVSGIDPLTAGRLVSLLSTLATMVLVALLGHAVLPPDAPRLARIGAAAIAALCLAAIPSILTWALLMRVDMLACALTFGGLLLAVRALARPGAIPFAALLFVLAIFTKQTSIAGPAAALIGLWLVRPRSAVLLLAWCIGLGLPLLVAAELASGGGFLRHILLYNLNRVALDRSQLLLLILWSQAIVLVLSLFGVAAAVRRIAGPLATLRDRLTHRPADAAAAMLLLFLALKTAMLPMILKSGASDNYVIEWSCGAAIFVALAVLPVLKIGRGTTPWPAPVLVVWCIVALPIDAYSIAVDIPDPAAAHSDDTALASVVERIRASNKPVISDDMVLIVRAGRPVLWEPAIAAELAHSGLYDDTAFAAKVRHRDFGFFVTRGVRGTQMFDERYNPVVADAIDAAYPRKEQVAGLTLHLPAP